ncbi:MAG: hypothetical protein ABGZ53_01895 [Fuerstiella sp.]
MTIRTRSSLCINAGCVLVQRQGWIEVWHWLHQCLAAQENAGGASGILPITNKCLQRETL